MILYTIGFTKKTAEEFFNKLIENRVKKVIDIRLNNSSQLAGFAKGKDLKYFLKTIGNIDYTYNPEFAPTKELLDDYKKKIINWEEYKIKYNEILDKRQILSNVDFFIFKDACLLCSEPTSDKCHRRLLAEYLAWNNNNIHVKHL